MNQDSCIVCLMSPLCPDHKTPGPSDRKEQHLSFRKGHPLFHQDEAGNGIFHILEGTVKLFTIEENGKEIIHSLIAAGETIGLSAIFSEEHAPYNAQAMEDVRCTYLGRQAVRELIHREPALCEDLLRRVGKKLARAYHRNCDLIRLSVKERMARCLLDLSDLFGEREGNNIRITLRLTREEIASVVGVASETAIRFISDFKKKNIIAEDQRQIIILDRESLLRLFRDGDEKLFQSTAGQVGDPGRRGPEEEGLST